MIDKLDQYFEPISKWKSVYILAGRSQPQQLSVTGHLHRLLPQTHYELRVRAQNDLDWSPPSSHSHLAASTHIIFTDQFKLN